MKEKKIIGRDIGFIDEVLELCKNLISMESHAMGSYLSTRDEGWLEIMKNIREKRTKYLSLITKDSGQSWCLSKHLCESIMRLQECCTRFLSTSQMEEAKICLEDARDLYRMFFIINGHIDKKLEVITSA